MSRAKRTKNLGLKKVAVSNNSSYGRASGSYGTGGFGGGDVEASDKGARALPVDPGAPKRNTRVTGVRRLTR